MQLQLRIVKTKFDAKVLHREPPTHHYFKVGDRLFTITPEEEGHVEFIREDACFKKESERYTYITTLETLNACTHNLGDHPKPAIRDHLKTGQR